MSHAEETRHRPGAGRGSGAPGPGLMAGWSKERLVLVGVFILDAINWSLHTANYSLANSIGSDAFLVDILPFIPAWGVLENVSVGSLINGVLAIVAVTVPVVIWSQILSRPEILTKGRAYFTDPLTALIAGLLALLYALVVVTELSVLLMRIAEEVGDGPLPDVGTESASILPMFLMSISLIVANAGFGLATAIAQRSYNAARR